MAWQPDPYDPSQHQQRLRQMGVPAGSPPPGQPGPQPPFAPPPPPQPQGYYGQQPQVTWQEPGRPPQPVYGFGGAPPAAPPRKRRRVFMWVFLAIQALFLIWIITGVSGNARGQGTQAHAQAVSFCSNGGWQYLYPSYADCVTRYGNDLNSASDAGTALGVGVIIGVWVAVDVIMGVTYVIVRLSRRRA